MGIKQIISTMVVISGLLISAKAYCGNELSYEDTIRSLQETMANNASDVRKESYDYIKFDKCRLEYRVLGTYPVGDLYDIKFSNIDFSTLNYQVSKVGHDYTAFIVLNFGNYFHSKDGFKNLEIHTLVVNVSSDEKAQQLFKTFLHLGELCGARKSLL